MPEKQSQVLNEQDWLASDSEISKIIRSTDWSNTLIGPLESWPHSLTSVLSLCLHARSPIAIYWGPEYVFFYNDAFRPIVGDKQTTMGRRGSEVWPEIWDTVEPWLQSVRNTGRGRWYDDRLLLMQRFGYVEECYFEFNLSPIKASDGSVAGILNLVTETTYRVLNQRRTQLLRNLASQTSAAKSPEEACALAASAIADDRADIPFALLYLIDGDRRQACLAGSTGVRPNSPAVPKLVKLNALRQQSWSWSILKVAQTGRAEVISDLSRQFGMCFESAWPEPPREALALPILGRSPKSELAGVLIAGVSPRRALDENYRDFFDRVSGHIAAAISNARAYEEERLRAEKLEELDRAKTVFFSNISHELRTPLTLMLGPLEDTLAHAEQVLTEEDTHALAVAHRNGLRLLKLVNTLLDFSRIEAGRTQAIYRSTDLTALTSSLASVFRSAIEKAGLDLIVNCLPLPEGVYVDRSMWEKIVLNLLSNAFKFTSKGRIVVRQHSAGDHVALSVEDTGCGIPKSELGNVFKRFYRIEETQGRSYEGTGIGLSLVDELVKLHGGSVGVASAVGQGSTFTVTLPFGKEHLPADRIGGDQDAYSAATISADTYVEEALRWLPDADKEEFAGAAHVSVEPVEGPRPRVLLADDNADMREYVRKLLSVRYNVTSVPDGEAAWTALKECHPDLLLSDVMMPKLDGFGLLKRLREDARTRSIPVILLSARAGEDSRVEGLEKGADDYLIKPFTARELVARVHANLEMARIRQDCIRMEERLRAEQETAGKLREQAQLLDLAPVLALDLEYRIILWNQGSEAFYGWSKAEALGRVSEELLQTVFPGALKDIKAQLFRQGHWEGELLHSCKNGRRVAVASRWMLYRDENDRPVAIIEVNNDITELKLKQQETLALTERLINAQEEERSRIARELHDDLGQQIAGLSIWLSNLRRQIPVHQREATEQADRLHQRISEIAVGIRNLSHQLHPAVLEHAGLIAALRSCCKEFSSLSGVRVSLQAGDNFDDIAYPLTLCIYRVVQEALQNVAKHASTENAEVYLTREDGFVRLEVSDHGVGFTPGQARASGGLGLASIKERVRLANGTFTLESEPKRGTTLRVEIPISGAMLGSLAA